jgi:flagellar hook-basal body complex protein FliE
VNQTQVEANTQAQQLATGEADNIQDVVLSMEKADLALQLTVQVAQRAIEAYREISRMQV